MRTDTRSRCTSPSVRLSYAETSAKIFGYDIGSEVSKLLTDHTHSFRPGKPKFKQFRHAVLRITMSQAMCSSRPPEHRFAGLTKYERKIDATGEVVVLTIFDVPVHDSSRFGEPNVF